MRWSPLNSVIRRPSFLGISFLRSLLNWQWWFNASHRHFFIIFCTSTYNRGEAFWFLCSSPALPSRCHFQNAHQLVLVELACLQIKLLHFDGAAFGDVKLVQMFFPILESSCLPIPWTAAISECRENVYFYQATTTGTRSLLHTKNHKKQKLLISVQFHFCISPHLSTLSPHAMHPSDFPQSPPGQAAGNASPGVAKIRGKLGQEKPQPLNRSLVQLGEWEDEDDEDNSKLKTSRPAIGTSKLHERYTWKTQGFDFVW